jgi:DNA-binding response OmpR family regulator
MVTAGKGNAFPSSSLNEGDEARRVTTLDDHNFSFGPFTLFPGRRVLQRNGTTVRLGSRACEILVALVERAGELVDKNFDGARLAGHQRRRRQSQNTNE